MTVFTVNCNKTFIVALDKAEDFKNKRLDTEYCKKIESAKNKFKNIKTCV